MEALTRRPHLHLFFPEYVFYHGTKLTPHANPTVSRRASE